MSADVPVRGFRVGHLQPYVGSGIKQADVPLPAFPSLAPPRTFPSSEFLSLIAQDAKVEPSRSVVSTPRSSR